MAECTACQHRWLFSFFFFLQIVATASASNNSTIADVWPDLAAVPKEPKIDGVSYGSGGLVFGTCCNLALREAVQMVDGKMEFVPGQTILHGDIEAFRNNESPCTGNPKYTGYEASVSQVTIPYPWCAAKCPGWDRTEVDEVDKWVQQILAYTLPAAIFCINIPRRRQITIPRQYFPSLNFLSLLSLLYRIPIATILAILDTTIWLIVVFCLAGPMMLSGVYESVLDYKILRQLSSTNNQTTITFRQRCHLALILLIGNLDHDYAWDDSVSAVAGLPNVRVATIHTDAAMGRKIRMLLQAQQNFGSAIGIGVLFFITSFVYACLDLQGKFGNSFYSHNLAFGIFWMVIPHVAIVSNFPLTGSGSCIWDLVNLENMPKHYRISGKTPKGKGCWEKLKTHFGFSSTDNSKTIYLSAWQWDRAHCRMEWLERYLHEYPALNSDLRRKLHISHVERFLFIWVPTLAMLLAPCALGCLISVTTPTVGISCKSIIPLTYSGIQISLMILWQFDVSLTADRFEGHRWLSRLLKSVFLFLAFLGGFVAVGGTIAADIGLVNNCLCYISMSQWLRRYTDPTIVVVLGSDIDARNYYSHQFWLRSGIAAASFLFAMVYFGWWLSRFISTRFYAVCDQISGTISLQKP